MKKRVSTWEELSKKRGGIYEKATFTKHEHVTFPYKNTNIRLESYTTSAGSTPITYTRVRCIFKNPDQMSFKIYHEGFFSKIGKKFGMQDIIIGDEEFDERFVIKGTDEEKVKQLLNDYQLKRLLLLGKPIYLEIKVKDRSLLASDESMLYYQANGIIKDMDTLENILDVFERVMDCMVELELSSEAPLLSVLKG